MLSLKERVVLLEADLTAAPPRISVYRARLRPPEHLMDLGLTVARQAHAMVKARLQLTPDEEAGAVLLRPKPVQQHRHPKHAPLERTTLRQTHDARMRPPLLEAGGMDHLEVVGVLGNEHATERCRPFEHLRIGDSARPNGEQ